MGTSHFDLNRPVHLARRDVFYKRAVELLYMPTQSLDSVTRLQHVEHVLGLLRTAELHAFFALRSAKASASEESFLHFLKLVSDNVQSVHAMVGHQLQLESGGGFLGEFLGATPRESLLPALHYQRRAEDILQGLWHILRLAQSPYLTLHEQNIESLDEGERERYGRAAASFEEEVLSKYTPPESAPR